MKIKFLGKILPEPNGCGPRGLQWAIPNFIFKPACDLHDNLFYTKQGIIRSNISFYVRMRYCIYMKRRPFVHNMFFECVALWYFLVVMALGWTCYD